MVSPVYIRPLLALLFMAVIVAIAAVVLRNSPQGLSPVPSATQQLPHNIDVALKKARFSEIQDGLVAWELIAERAEYDKGGDMAYLSDIRMEFKQTKSHGAVTVTANNGVYSITTKTVRLNGQVHLITEDDASFKTESIVYNGVTAHFSTPDPVLFHQQRLQLAAVGMDLGVNNQRASFHSAVDAAINIR